VKSGRQKRWRTCLTPETGFLGDSLVHGCSELHQEAGSKGLFRRSRASDGNVPPAEFEAAFYGREGPLPTPPDPQRRVSDGPRAVQGSVFPAAVGLEVRHEVAKVVLSGEAQQFVADGLKL
jgi:hypothetical protein